MLCFISPSILISVLCLSLLASARNHFSFDAVKHLVTFGDSYTTQYLDVSTLQYGCTNCTSAGGPNWVEYFSWSINITYWNLAYNSAPVSNAIVGQQGSSVIDVTQQVSELFPQYIKKAAKFLDSANGSNTLYTVWVGINDIDLTYDWNATSALDQRIMQQYAQLMNDLHMHGASQFLFFSVPPIDRSPMWQNHGPSTANVIKSRVQDFNKKMKMMARTFQNTNDGKYFYFDVWSVFTELLDNPSRYGFQNVDSYCGDSNRNGSCLPEDEYFWHNDLHPTSKVHEYVAKELVRYLQYQ
ncbi:GDSL lipase/esterase [Radiomyces spectabilis]|uniref:GDSL lipase/esterase n=1 Tax=Radiomyces spectabilis TaxID=64574 RepID=UPI0022201EC2|nr:GDSL lipase/esterase [Radiomyces spectabilis]KAI8377413.1 GDSL lipase/esterase [Radiomyces spectabilis]